MCYTDDNKYIHGQSAGGKLFSDFESTALIVDDHKESAYSYFPYRSDHDSQCRTCGQLAGGMTPLAGLLCCNGFSASGKMA